MGRGYVVEHCVAVFLQQNERKLFENYIADALYFIAHCVGVKLSKRLYEIRDPAPVDDRDPEETTMALANRLGIEVVDDGCNESEGGSEP